MGAAKGALVRKNAGRGGTFRRAFALERHDMKTRKRKLIYLALGVVCACCLGYFFAFTQTGAFATVRFAFDEVQPGVYFDRSFVEEREGVLEMIDQAQARVDQFFGGLQSRPMIAVSDDEATLRRLGWTGNPALTSTHVLFGAHSYVVVAPRGLNVDVIAHELTHAELHARVYRGKPLVTGQIFPIWFDEGLALQNDYRPSYNEAAWYAATDGGRSAPDMDQIATSAQFYPEDKEQRHFNYLVSGHEVAAWLKLHGLTGLEALIEGVNQGRPFAECYLAPQ